MKRVTVTVPLGVHEVIADAARRNGLRVGEMVRELLIESPSLLDEIRRMDAQS